MKTFIIVLIVSLALCSCKKNKNDDLFISIKGVRISKPGYITPSLCFNQWVVIPSKPPVKQKKYEFLNKVMPKMQKLSTSSEADKKVTAYKLADFLKTNFNHAKKIDPIFFKQCSDKVRSAKELCTNLPSGNDPSARLSCIDNEIKKFMIELFKDSETP